MRPRKRPLSQKLLPSKAISLSGSGEDTFSIFLRRGDNQVHGNNGIHELGLASVGWSSPGQDSGGPALGGSTPGSREGTRLRGLQS